MSPTNDNKLSSSTINLQLEKYKAFAWGTSAGVIARGLFWTTEWMYYVKSMENISYPESFKKLYQPNTLREVYKIFLKTGLIQNIGKSFSNAGALSYLSNSTLSPLEKSTLIGLIPAETAFTFYYDYLKINSIKKLQHNTTQQTIGLWSKPMGRVFAASYVRSFLSSVFTFYPVYQIEIGIKKTFPQFAQNLLVSASAGFIGSAIAQLAVMPITNFQTKVIENPTSTLSDTVKTILKKENRKHLWDGGAGRAVNRGLYYMFVFGANNYFNSLNKHDECDVKNTPKKNI